MKNPLITTVLFSTLLVTMPGHADCPFRHTDKSDESIATVKQAPAVQHRSYATPEPTVSWHDLHWME